MNSSRVGSKLANIQARDFGLTNDGKGQPQQTNAMSHGCSPSLFRAINVLRTE